LTAPSVGADESFSKGLFSDIVGRGVNEANVRARLKKSGKR
jgi:hypothetical protein